MGRKLPVLVGLRPLLATWDIRSHTCALTMSSTHIFSSFIHITGKLFHIVLSARILERISHVASTHVSDVANRL
jgi:hypothetical protein